MRIVQKTVVVFTVLVNLAFVMGVGVNLAKAHGWGTATYYLYDSPTPPTAEFLRVAYASKGAHLVSIVVLPDGTYRAYLLRIDP